MDFKRDRRCRAAVDHSCNTDGRIDLNAEDSYLANCGNVCPECGSFDIESNDGGADGAECWRDVHCNECGKEWQDLYRLVGYTMEEIRR